jgi:hypothetical protein
MKRGILLLLGLAALATSLPARAETVRGELNSIIGADVTTIKPGSAEAEVLKANVLFRAVQVAEGRSIVRFSFRPLDGLMADLREKVLGPEEDEPSSNVAMVP